MTATSTQRAQDSEASEALSAALRQRSSGMLEVLSGTTTATIHLQDGHILWAQISSLPSSLNDVLRPAGVSLESREASEIVAESHRTHCHVADVLVRRQIIEQQQAHELLRQYIEERVRLIVTLPDAKVHFVAKNLRKLQSVRFRQSEFPGIHPRDGRAAPFALMRVSTTNMSNTDTSESEQMELLASVLALSGVLGAAIVNKTNGRLLLSEGAEVNNSTIQAELALLATLGGEAEDVVSVAGERCFILRVSKRRPELAVHVVFSLNQVNVGMARITFARACD